MNSSKPFTQSIRGAMAGVWALAAWLPASAALGQSPLGPPSTRPTTQPAATQAGAPATTQARPRSYTAPGAAYRQLSFLGETAALGALPPAQTAGKALTEARIDVGAANLGGVSGRSGLTGAATGVTTTLSARSGLGEGRSSNLGFASQRANIFTRQINRVSGPGGGCEQLSRAGFFVHRGPCAHHR